MPAKYEGTKDKQFLSRNYVADRIRCVDSTIPVLSIRQSGGIVRALQLARLKREKGVERVFGWFNRRISESQAHFVRATINPAQLLVFAFAFTLKCYFVVGRDNAVPVHPSPPLSPILPRFIQNRIDYPESTVEMLFIIEHSAETFPFSPRPFSRIIHFDGRPALHDIHSTQTILTFPPRIFPIIHAIAVDGCKYCLQV